MNNTNSGPGRQRIFLSYASDDTIKRKAAFERSVLGLLSQRAEDYVASMNVERVIATFDAQASSSECNQSDDDHDKIEIAETTGIGNTKSHGHDLLSRLNAARKSAASAPEFTQATEALRGAHNIEALEAGEELVDIAAQRPSRGIWQLVSGKGGSGKTTMLLHLACLAQRRSDMNIAVIDVGASEIVTDTGNSEVVGVAGADLVFIDNAHRSPRAPRQTDWWAQFAKQVSKSACVLIAVTPDSIGSANEPWRKCSDAWRDTTIRSFDCAFRHLLIDELSRRHVAKHGGPHMTAATIGRLAEELWGSGWQLAEAVDACRGYTNVMAREPKLAEIDEIASNIAGVERQHARPLELIRRSVKRAFDLERVSSRGSQEKSSKIVESDVVLHLTKVISGLPLNLLSRQLGITRGSAIEAMYVIERARTESREFCRSLLRLEAELRRPQ